MIINGNGKKNKLFGSAENDTIDGAGGNDQLFGNAGNDFLIGGNGKDQLFGGLGDDTLIGGAGKDVLLGGAGDDNYVVNLARKGSGAKRKAVLEDTVTENAGEGTDTLTLTGSIALKRATNFVLADNFENLDARQTGTTLLNLIGNASDNIILGNSAANSINGGLGNDLLIGMANIDTLTGGAGNDIFFFNSFGGGEYDVVTDFATGQDKIQLLSSTFSALPQSLFVEMFALGAGAADTNDYLIYDINSGFLYYDADANGAGAQQAVAKFNPGTVVAQSDIVGALGQLIQTNSTTGAPLTGGQNFDRLVGKGGDDTLDGGAGYDTLIGGAGDDTYILNIGQVIGGIALQDEIVEVAGGGNDTVELTGTLGSDTAKFTLANTLENLDGHAVLNTRLELVGNEASNRITGNDANNSLSGGAGNDTLIGGLGNDTLDGGANADRFVFDTTLNTTTNMDTILNFNVTDDQIQLSKTLFTAIGLSLDATEFISGAGVNAALDSDDFIIFNTTSGALYYDADGNGVGAAVQFATLSGTVGTLAATDFDMI